MPIRKSTIYRADELIAAVLGGPVQMYIRISSIETLTPPEEFDETKKLSIDMQVF